MSWTSAITPAQFTTFGELLKFLRHRAGLTQRDLSIAVNYSEGQISRLEKNERAPDAAVLAARFVPALELERDPEWTARLLELAVASRVQIEAGEKARAFVVTPNNLPIQRTGFIGREKEIAELKHLLSRNEPAAQEARLLTLTGVGGSGKTRLAVRAATELLAEFFDGAYFVNLAPLSEAILVIPTIAQTLGVTGLPGQTLLEALQDHLRAKHLLLVLDNFEQVLDAAPMLVGLLTEAPFLKILVTSRVGFNLSIEQEFPVPPLPVPKFDRSPEELMQNEAVALFVQRAQAVRQEFQLNQTNERAIAEICVRLDGLPLAIELAAARTQALSPGELLARLSHRLGLLTRGARDLPARQQTLRNAIDWSYHLLQPQEQTLFARLGVFVGGWMLDAAEQVCKAEMIFPGEIVDALQTLLDHNLIQSQVTEEGGVRFTMLETLREYAVEQLESSGEKETLQLRHARYFLALADAEPPELGNEDAYNDWIERIRMEQNNFRAAVAWSQTVPGNAEIGLRLVMVVRWFSSLEESRILSERALAHAMAEGDYDPRSLAGIFSFVGQNLAILGDYAVAEERFASSLELFQELGDGPETVHALERWGWVAREQGRTETAIARLRRALALARELKSEELACTVTTSLAEALTLQGDTAAAKTLLEENLPRARKLGYTSSVAWTLNHLGHVAQIDRDYELANRLYTESLSLLRGHGEGSTAEALHALGETALAKGDPLLATTYLTKSLGITQKNSAYPNVLAWCLAGLAGVAVLNEEPERAAFLWGAAERLRQRLGVREGPATHATHERLKAQARAQVGQEAFAAAWRDGQSASLEQAVSNALTT